MKLYEFPCGCSFPVLQEFDDGRIPLLDFDIEKVPQDCKAVWNLLGEGKTKGVFQLETSLGRQWTKKLKPENLEHMSALGALLRPGSLRAVDEQGISMTEHYCRRKNQQEEVSKYQQDLDLILNPTYNVLSYQEQSLQIAKVIAGFTLQEADSLRKAMGKKLAAEMAKCKKIFLDGAAKVGKVTKEQAEEIFGWIEKSQRYSFNKSHAFSYGTTGYDTAYIKAHFPLAFYTSWLYHAKNNQDPRQEISELVNDAKLFDIEIQVPDLRDLEKNFYTDGKIIKFGLSDIKGIGEAQVNKLTETIKNLKLDLNSLDWKSFLLECGMFLTPNILMKLIQVGALKWMQKLRQDMLEEFKVFDSLTKLEREWLKNNWNNQNFIDALKDLAKPKEEGGGAANKNRRSIIFSQAQLLENPPTPRNDNPNWIAWTEEQLLGVSLSCSKIDSCDIGEVNTSCKDFLAGKAGYMVFGVEVNQIREVKTKKGKSAGSKMAYMTISDNSCSLQDVVCFPDVWKEAKEFLTEKNMVMIHAERDNKKNSDLLIVKKVWQAK